MPVTKSAANALRQTIKRTIANKSKKVALKAELKIFEKTKSPKSLPKIYSIVDKMVKTHVVHKNKAKRIKSQAALLVAKNSKSPSLKQAKKTAKKRTS